MTSWHTCFTCWHHDILCDTMTYFVMSQHNYWRRVFHGVMIYLLHYDMFLYHDVLFDVIMYFVILGHFFYLTTYVWCYDLYSPYFLMSCMWRTFLTFWRHDILLRWWCSILICLSCDILFNSMMYFFMASHTIWCCDIFLIFFWRIYCPDELYDVMMYFVMLWHAVLIFLIYVLMSWCTFHIFWSHDMLFDILM